MRRIGGWALVTVLSCCLLTFAASEAVASSKYAALVMDEETGTVLFERSGSAKRYPASLTKIMTLYMLFDAIESGQIGLRENLRVSKRASGQPPSKLGLKPGQKIRAEDAIKALVTKSANDVAVVVAEAIAGTEFQFARLMTEKARALGMKDTTFRNASGLPHSRQVTTARDMAKLAIAIRRDFPNRYHYFKVATFAWKGATYRNHNKLLGRYQGTDGIKTGYIRASGFNLVATVNRDGRRLIGIVFGGKTGPRRDRHMKRILDKSFKAAEQILVAQAKPPLPVPRPFGRKVQLASVVPVIAETEPEVGSLEDGTGDWGVQVGAYSTEVRATRSIEAAREHLPDVLGEADGKVESLQRRSGPIYRARLFGLSEQEARDACLALKRRLLPCVPVPARASLGAPPAQG